MKKFIVHISKFILFLFFLLLTTTYQQNITLASYEPAIYNQTKSLLPKEVIPNPSPSNLFDSLRNFFTNLVNPQKFFLQSQSLHQAYLPQEVKENSSPVTTSVLNKINNLLGGSTGYYDVTLPKEIQGGDATSSGKAFEQANFPKGINPVTGQ